MCRAPSRPCSQAAQAGGPAPENVAWTHGSLATSISTAGNWTTGRDAIQCALAAFPSYLHAQAGLGRVRAAQGRTAEAMTLYKNGHRRVPLPQYVQELGDLYAATGDAANAKQQYDLVSYIFHVFEVNGVDVGIEKAAFLADQDSDSAQAVQLAANRGARPATTSTPRTAWPGCSIVPGATPTRSPPSSRRMRLGTQNAIFYFHLGMIYDKLGDAAQARQNLQKALAINPHFSVKYAPQAAAAAAKVGEVTDEIALRLALFHWSSRRLLLVCHARAPRAPTRWAISRSTTTAR